MTDTSKTDSLLSTPREHAESYAIHGLRVIPIRTDGSKRPDIDWGQFIEPDAPYPKDKLQSWFRDDAPCGVAVVLGDNAEGLINFDIEYADFAEEFEAFIGSCFPRLVGKIPTVRTPGRQETGGRHFYLRQKGVSPIKPLASVTPKESVERTGVPGHTTAIELRGQGQYNLVPGGDIRQHERRHPYLYCPNSPPIWEAPRVDVAELDAMIEFCRGLSRVEVDRSAHRENRSTPPPRSDGNLRPGDDFNMSDKAPPMREIIANHFDFVYARGDVEYYRRKGKSVGVSATYGHARNPVTGVPLFYCFTSNAPPFDADRSYSKFSAYCLAQHGANFSAASKDLAKRGFGTKGVGPKEIVRPNSISGPEGVFVNPLQERTVDQFPVEVFPECVQDFARQLSKSMDTPLDFPCTMILAVASSAIGTTRKLELKGGHTMFCPLYVACVAKPGGKKSPTLWSVCDPVVSMANDYEREYREKMELYEMAAEQGGKEGAGPKPQYKRVQCRVFTAESLAPILSSNPRGIIVIKDELSGLINSMNQYRGGKGADREFWLELWSCVDQDVDRKSQEGIPLRIRNPFVSIVGGIQPEKLAVITNPLGDDDGFADRFLYCYPEERVCLNYDIDSQMDELSKRRWEVVYNELHSQMRYSIQSNRDGSETEGPAIVHSSREALLEYQSWFHDHMTQLEHVDFPPRLKGPFLKMRDHAARFALVIHCLRTVSPDHYDHPEDPLVLDARSMVAGIALAEYFKSHTAKAYGVVIRNKDDRAAYKAISYIIRKPDRSVSAREFMRNNDHLVQKVQEVHDLFDDMEDRGWGRAQKGKRGSLRFTAYQMNHVSSDSDDSNEGEDDKVIGL